MVLKGALFLTVMSAACALSGMAQVKPDVQREQRVEIKQLKEDFFNLTEETRPWVYYYWIKGHLSKEGITKDLEAMSRVGIGQVLVGSDINMGPGEYGPIIPLTEAWWELIDHTIRETTRLKMNCGFFNSTGWSQAGGPWNGVQQSMRYVSSAELRLKGGTVYEGELPKVPRDFSDVALLAFPAPRDDEGFDPSVLSLSSATEIENLSYLTDGKENTVCYLNDRVTVMDIKFKKSVTARSLTVVPNSTRSNFSVTCEVLAKDARGEFQSIDTFTINHRLSSWGSYAKLNAPYCMNFSETTSDHFQLRFTMVHGTKIGLAEITLSGAARIDDYVGKQLLRPLGGTPKWHQLMWPEQKEVENAALAIDVARVLNITDKVTPDGRLKWEVPEGDWVVMRTGMLPTRAGNGPAHAAGRGLEVDKMNRKAVEHHFNNFVKKIYERLPAAERSSFTHVVTDSYEVGFQNWTDGFAQHFEEVYGYDPLPWLPVMTGRIVNSRQESDRFLWDLRRLVADDIATEYVGGLREISNQYGLKLWLENYGHFGFPSEFLKYGGQADQVNGEFWLRGVGESELQLAASAAHVYNKPVVGAEAYTAMGEHWLMHPDALKTRGDWAFSKGINHFVLHVYIQQAYEDKLPGMNAWFGTEFNRHNTWFELGKGWVDYLRRCHFMLQQGHFVADVAYYIGEDTPKTDGVQNPALPSGYQMDYVNAEAILTLMTVKDGRLELPGGASYQLLVLPPLSTMRPEVLLKLQELVAQGATIMGEAPTHSPSLKHFPACDEEVRKLSATLWSAKKNAKGGQVIKRSDLEKVLTELGSAPAFVCADKSVLWTHRKTKTDDIYFVSNQQNKEIIIHPKFKTTSTSIELWDPKTGKITSNCGFERTEHGVQLPMKIEPKGSMFVVIKRQAEPVLSVVETQRGGQHAIIPVARSSGGESLEALIAENGTYRFKFSDNRSIDLKVEDVPGPVVMNGPWELSFPAGMDAPERITLDALKSWTEFKDPGIKYFSGTGTYTTTFTLSRKQVQGAGTDKELLLDFGKIGVIAKVTLNDKEVAILWTSPFEVNVSKDVKEGENTLKIEVANVWVNRRVGDVKYPGAFPGQEAKQFETWAFATKELMHFSKGKVDDVYPDDPLVPSGLMGPVQLRTVRRVELARLFDRTTKYR